MLKPPLERPCSPSCLRPSRSDSARGQTRSLASLREVLLGTVTKRGAERWRRQPDAARNRMERTDRSGSNPEAAWRDICVLNTLTTDFSTGYNLADRIDRRGH